MTPILIGRWQTRVVMLGTLGLLITALFYLANRGGPFFLVLGYVLAFGLVWDIVYIALQKLRWDRDWPTPFQVANGIIEGALIYALIASTGLPGIKAGSVPPGLFVAQYGLIWLSIFLWLQGPMRVVFPWWRFRGGRIV
jgi:hypothetical protein